MIKRLDEILELLDCGLATRPEIKEAIERSFTWFQRYDGFFARESRVAIAGSAKAIAKGAATLLKELEVAPASLRDFLLLPLEARRVDREGEAAPAPAVLLNALQILQSDCKRILADAQPESSGPEPNRAQLHCARLAFGLMTAFSDHPITGGVDGRFVSLAGLLYESLTDEADANLQRRCNEILKHPPPIQKRRTETG
jgi:hypothetical protein